MKNKKEEVGNHENKMTKRYAKSHEWVEEVDGKYRVGLTEYAKDQLGDIVFVNLPEPGDIVEADQPCGEVESTKAVDDIIAPVSGQVVEINEEVLDAPEMINDAAETNWLFTLEDVEGWDELLEQAAYEDFIADL